MSDITDEILKRMADQNRLLKHVLESVDRKDLKLKDVFLLEEIKKVVHD